MDVREFWTVGYLQVVDTVNHENQIRVVLELWLERLEKIVKVERRHVVPNFKTIVAHIAHQVARGFHDFLVDIVICILLAYGED